MFKFTHGSITNMNGVTKDIVMRTLPIKFRDVLIASAIMGAGAFYIAFMAFKHGVTSFEQAEYDTMVDLGIIK